MCIRDSRSEEPASGRVRNRGSPAAPPPRRIGQNGPDKLLSHPRSVASDRNPAPVSYTHLFHSHRSQFRRHHSQNARAGDDLVSLASIYLGYLRHQHHLYPCLLYTSIPERGRNGRYQEEEDHDDAVHGEKLVVSLRLNERALGFDQMQAHKDGKKAANKKHQGN